MQLIVFIAVIGWVGYLVLDGLRDYRRGKRSERRDLYRASVKISGERCGWQ